MRCTKIGVSLAACGIALSLFTAVAHAGDSKVNCSSPGHAGKIANVLSRLNPADTNVVHVSGHCRENLIIQGFDRLSLIAEPGAVIEDASGGKAAVVEILDSQRVLIQGFTIRGGNSGVFCHEYSFCRFIGDTVEQTAAYGAIWSDRRRRDWVTSLSETPLTGGSTFLTLGSEGPTCRLAT